MQFHVITLFPEMIDQLLAHGVLGRAVRQQQVGVKCWNPRDYTHDRHRTVDDRPYGGGPGMLMKVQPLADAISAARSAAGGTGRVIYLSPQGRRFTQADAQTMASAGDDLILIAGRYEGIDERLIEQEIDLELSIGDYVLSGGELPAAILIDAVSRLLPGVLGDAESAEQDSFMNGLLDCPHYTRPEEIDGQRVPDILLGGDHAMIEQWRLKQSLGRTWQRRPDLLEKLTLDDEQKALLDAYIREHRAENETD